MDVNQVINVIWEMSRENDRLEFERRKLQLEINNLKHEILKK